MERGHAKPLRYMRPEANVRAAVLVAWDDEDAPAVIYLPNT